MLQGITCSEISKIKKNVCEVKAMPCHFSVIWVYNYKNYTQGQFCHGVKGECHVYLSDSVVNVIM